MHAAAPVAHGCCAIPQRQGKAAAVHGSRRSRALKQTKFSINVNEIPRKARVVAPAHAARPGGTQQLIARERRFLPSFHAAVAPRLGFPSPRRARHRLSCSVLCRHGGNGKVGGARQGRGARSSSDARGGRGVNDRRR